MPAATQPPPPDMLGRILKEATRLFVTHGYRGISMREIGEAVGISKAGLYYHFKDKQALFLAVLQSNVTEVGDIVARAEAKHVGARTRVAQLMQDLLALPPQQRALIRMAGQELVHLEPEAREAFEQVYHAKFVGRIAGLMAEAVHRGEIQPANPQLLAWLLMGMAYPFFSTERLPSAANEAAALITRIFFDGLATQEDTAVDSAENQP